MQVSILSHFKNAFEMIMITMMMTMMVVAAAVEVMMMITATANNSYVDCCHDKDLKSKTAMAATTSKFKHLVFRGGKVPVI